MALVGDSHLRALRTPLTTIARERGWHLVTYLHATCPFGDEKPTLELRGSLACSGPNATTLDRLLDERPALVITTASAWTGFPQRGDEPQGSAGMARYWSTLMRAGIPVVAIKDVPRPRADVVACVAQNPQEPNVCDQPRAQALARHDRIPRAAELSGAALVDLTDRFCDDVSCRAVVGNVAVYRDHNHLTETYARSLTQALDARLAAAVPPDLLTR